jgi:hypothetical protein
LSPGGAEDKCFCQGEICLAFIPRKGRRCCGTRSCIGADGWPVAAGREALSITVTGVRNSDGVVRCALFNSPAAFPKIGQEWRGVIAPIRGGAALRVHWYSGGNLRRGLLSCRA